MLPQRHVRTIIFEGRIDMKRHYLEKFRYYYFLSVLSFLKVAKYGAEPASLASLFGSFTQELAKFGGVFS